MVEVVQWRRHFDSTFRCDVFCVFVRPDVFLCVSMSVVFLCYGFGRCQGPLPFTQQQTNTKRTEERGGTFSLLDASSTFETKKCTVCLNADHVAHLNDNPSCALTHHNNRTQEQDFFFFQYNPQQTTTAKKSCSGTLGR
jgi:hypothetical protein